MYKSFGSEEEAQEYVRNPPAKKGESPEEIAAKEQARVAKEEARATKAAEALAAKAAKEEEKAAKAAETKAAREKAKAEKEQAKAAAGPGKKRKAVPATATSAEAGKAKSARKTEEKAEPVKTDAAADVEVKPVKKLKMGKAMLQKAMAKAKAKAMAAKAKAKGTAKAAGSKAVITVEAASAKVVKKVKPAKEPKAATDSSTTKASKLDAPSSLLSEAVLNRAKELGMTSALQNLSSRAEIISTGLSAEALLDALVKADGLVNKAKSAILSPSTSDPISPSKDAGMDRLSLSLSPEKHEQEKQEKNDQEELAKTLKNLSSTLLMVARPATPATKEDVQMAAHAQPDLTAMQTQRIKENRERALARKAQAGK